jgi:nucleotide-binding universal stress UspA family protein
VVLEQPIGVRLGRDQPHLQIERPAPTSATGRSRRLIAWKAMQILLIVDAAHGEDDDASSPGVELLAQLAFETGLGTNVERILVRGEPAGAIVEAADAHTAAMTVIGSRGRGALASSVLGNVSSAVANRSVCPVILVRAQCRIRPPLKELAVLRAASVPAAIARQRRVRLRPGRPGVRDRHTRVRR